jgi:hypothetical protein
VVPSKLSLLTLDLVQVSELPQPIPLVAVVVAALDPVVQVVAVDVITTEPPCVAKAALHFLEFAAFLRFTLMQFPCQKLDTPSFRPYFSLQLSNIIGNNLPFL